jgi:hypothetical protein
MTSIRRIAGPLPGALITFLLLLALVAPAAVAGEEAAAAAAPAEEMPAGADKPPIPAAETIIEGAIEASGGRKAHEAIRNRHVTGTLDIPMAGIKGTLNTYEAAPASMAVITEITGVGTMRQGANGVEAWEVSMMGPQLKSGEEKEIMLFRTRFNAELAWKERYTSVETTGTDEVDGRPCYVVAMTPKVGRPEKRCYDTETFDLVRVELTEVSAMGEIPAVALTSDYREVDGIRIPFKMVNKAMGQEFTITIEKVEHNIDLPEGVFDPPPEIQALLDKAAGGGEAEAPAEGP